MSNFQIGSVRTVYALCTFYLLFATRRNAGMSGNAGAHVTGCSTRGIGENGVAAVLGCLVSMAAGTCSADLAPLWPMLGASGCG